MNSVQFNSCDLLNSVQREDVTASLNAEVAPAFQVGDRVSNFGAICVVESVCAERGLLVKVLPVRRKGVLQGGAFTRYYANPAKCAHVAHFEPCF